MQTYLDIAQLGIAALLVAAILLQSRGSGIGAAMGGDGNVYRTKRGVERTLFVSTIVLAVAFFGLAIARFLI